MKETWKAIENKLKEMAPLVYEDLNEGATQAQIEELERVIGAKLPDDFIEFYKIHNGQKPINFNPNIALFDHTKLMSIDEIIEEWDMNKGLLEAGEFVDHKNQPKKTVPDVGIKNGWWNTLWIPFFDDGDCNHYCIDLDPAKDGSYGQVIQTWHDDNERKLIARSFKDWFVQFKEDLLNEKLILNEYTRDEDGSLLYCGIDYKD
ncbi:MAG TPA: SMI1/KNR4 family protein [Niastella sp.]